MSRSSIGGGGAPGDVRDDGLAVVARAVDEHLIGRAAGQDDPGEVDARRAALERAADRRAGRAWRGRTRSRAARTARRMARSRAAGSRDRSGSPPRPAGVSTTTRAGSIRRSAARCRTRIAPASTSAAMSGRRQRHLASGIAAPRQSTVTRAPAWKSRIAASAAPLPAPTIVDVEPGHGVRIAVAIVGPWGARGRARPRAGAPGRTTPVASTILRARTCSPASPSAAVKSPSRPLTAPSARPVRTSSPASRATRAQYETMSSRVGWRRGTSNGRPASSSVARREERHPDREALDLLGDRAPIDDQDAEPVAPGLDRGRDPRRAGADDEHVIHLRHPRRPLVTDPRPVRPGRSRAAARRCAGRRGSRATQLVRARQHLAELDRPAVGRPGEHVRERLEQEHVVEVEQHRLGLAGHGRRRGGRSRARAGAPARAGTAPRSPSAASASRIPGAGRAGAAGTRSIDPEARGVAAGAPRAGGRPGRSDRRGDRTSGRTCRRGTGTRTG